MSPVLSPDTAETNSNVTANQQLFEQTARQRPHTSNRFIKKFAISILSVVMALACAEIFARIVVALGNPPDFGSPNFDRKYQLASREPIRFPDKRPLPGIVFLGTSYTEAGIYADYLRAKLAEHWLGLDPRNLAVRAAWPRDQLFLLKRLLQTGAKPALVFMDVTPMNFKFSPEYAERFSPALAKSNRNYELEPKTDWLNSLKSAVKEQSYFVRYRPYFKELLSALPERILNLDAYRAWLHDYSNYTEPSVCGWTPLPGFTTEKQLAQSAALRTADFKAWTAGATVDRSNLKYKGLENLKAFCKSQNIPLVLIWMPVQPNTKKVWQDALGITEDDCQKAFAKMADNKSVFFMDLHDTLKPDNAFKWGLAANEHFVDCDHVNTLGAIKTTKLIIDRLVEPPYLGILIKACHMEWKFYK